jgi:hypothetical protein
MNVTTARGALVLLTAATLAATVTAPARAVTVGPIKKLGTGAWTWFSEPRAVQIADTTVTGWVSTYGSVIVASYRETAGQVVTYNLHPRLNYDDHANPSLYLRRDGKITAFYSAHAGRNLYHRTTTGPGTNVTAWTAERTIGTNTTGPYGYTYSNPVWSPGESKLYLFWRGGSFLPTYATSGDEGASWAPARTLMLDNDSAAMRPYVKYTSRNGVIHMTYTQAHPRDRKTSIFYLRYTPGVGWQRIGGALAGGDGTPPFIPQDGDRVWNAWSYPGDERSWVHDIAVDAEDKPVIVFATFRASENYKRHWYWYARWTGSRWFLKRLVYAGPPISGAPELQYSAGISLDQENPSIVYLSRKPPEWGVFKVEVWVTTDKGTTWAPPVLVERGIRPVSPRRDPSTTVTRVLYLQGHYGSYTTYTTEVRIAGLR